MQEKSQKKSNFFERILQIIDYYEIKNVKSFACDYLGYSSMEKINRLQKEGTSPSYDILVDISNKFEKINVEWLLLGKGEMLLNKVCDFSEKINLAAQPQAENNIKDENYWRDKYIVELEENKELNKENKKLNSKIVSLQEKIILLNEKM